jgi:hypothetical protein
MRSQSRSLTPLLRGPLRTTERLLRWARSGAEVLAEQGGEDLTEALISRQIPRSVPIAVGPSAHGSANLAGPIELAELYRTSYLASSEHDDDKKERYKTNAPWSTLRRPPPS